MYGMLQCQTPAGYNADIRRTDTPKAINQTYSTAKVEYVTTDQLEKYQSLLKEFDVEKKLFPELFTEIPAAEDQIKRRINAIITWNFSKASLEVTGDGNAVFKILLTDRNTLYLGLNLNEEADNDSYFAFYDHDTCKRNGVGSFTDVVSDLVTHKII